MAGIPAATSLELVSSVKVFVKLSQIVQHFMAKRVHVARYIVVS